MRKTHLLGLALFAMLALSAIIAASAMASGYGKGGVEFTKAEPSIVTNEIVLADLKVPLIGTVEILCSGSFLGTVGPGAADEITNVFDLSGNEVKELGVTAGVTCVNVTGCVGTPKAWPEHLPWKTELMELTALANNPESVDNLLFSSGAGSPGFDVECSGLSDLCEVAEGLQWLENDPVKGVLVVEWNEVNIGTCTQGGLNSSDIRIETGADPIIEGETTPIEIVNP